MFWNFKDPGISITDILTLQIPGSDFKLISIAQPMHNYDSLSRHHRYAVCKAKTATKEITPDTTTEETVITTATSTVCSPL